MTNRWSLETTDQLDREFRKLDRAVQRRVLAYLHEIEDLDDPRQRGKALTANHAGVWRYRVGDSRLLAQLVDNTLTILTLSVGHRGNVYRSPDERARCAIPTETPVQVPTRQRDFYLR